MELLASLGISLVVCSERSIVTCEDRIHSCCMRAGAWLSEMSLSEVPVFVISWFI
jgi:hypothetical protein